MTPNSFPSMSLSTDKSCSGRKICKKSVMGQTATHSFNTAWKSEDFFAERVSLRGWPMWQCSAWFAGSADASHVSDN
eukprot:5727973-Amphidinium_carterae.1